MLLIIPKLGEEIDYKGGTCPGVSVVFILGFSEGIMFDDSSKLGEELGYKEAESRGVSDCALVGIHEGAILVTIVGNAE